MSWDIICQRKYRACPCSFVSFPGKIEPEELDMIANNGGTKNLLAIATPRNISNKTKDKLYNTALSENQNGKPCIINSSFSSDLQGSDEKAQGISNILNKKLQIGITSLFNNTLGQNSKPIFLRNNNNSWQYLYTLCYISITLSSIQHFYHRGTTFPIS